jgi:hypothetical protein
VIRDAMLADLPLAVLARVPEEREPFSSFRNAMALLDRGGAEEARAMLRTLLAGHGLASHDRLQTWSALRELGEAPDSTLLAPLGVVIEVGLDEGLDLLGVYDDCRTSYVNHSGRRVDWDRPDGSLDALVEPVLDAARALPPHMGVPWKGPKRALVLRGQVRLNIVTPAGLYFGEGQHAEMARHLMGGQLLRMATRLMVRLTELPRQQPRATRP